MHFLKNVFYSLNHVLNLGHDAPSRSTCPFRMLVHRQLIGKSSVMLTSIHNTKILKLLKLLMSIAFGQNRLDFALKIESHLVAKLFMLRGNSHTHNFSIYQTSSSCGSLRATFLRPEVIMYYFNRFNRLRKQKLFSVSSLCFPPLSLLFRNPQQCRDRIKLIRKGRKSWKLNIQQMLSLPQLQINYDLSELRLIVSHCVY